MSAAPAGEVGVDDFLKIDVRVGTVVEAARNEAARRPAYRLVVDFGPELGRKRSSAGLAGNYRPEDLVGRQVAAVVNFPARQVAKVLSEVLVLGFPDASGEVVLVVPERPVPDGGRLY